MINAAEDLSTTAKSYPKRKELYMFNVFFNTTNVYDLMRPYFENRMIYERRFRTFEFSWEFPFESDITGFKNTIDENRNMVNSLTKSFIHYSIFQLEESYTNTCGIRGYGIFKLEYSITIQHATQRFPHFDIRPLHSQNDMMIKFSRSLRIGPLFLNAKKREIADRVKALLDKFGAPIKIKTTQRYRPTKTLFKLAKQLSFDENDDNDFIRECESIVAPDYKTIADSILESNKLYFNSVYGQDNKKTIANLPCNEALHRSPTHFHVQYHSGFGEPINFKFNGNRDVREVFQREVPRCENPMHQGTKRDRSRSERIWCNESNKRSKNEFNGSTIAFG